MFTKPIIETINSRYSCRTYDGQPLSAQALATLNTSIELLPSGPFGTKPEFKIIAANETDSSMLKGLGTYGFIKGCTAFLVGLSGSSKEDLVDFGFQMEHLVLKATELGIGSCWLGGSFSRSRFAKTIGSAKTKGGSIIPCVISLGNIPPGSDKTGEKLRNLIGGGNRKELGEFMFEGDFSTPFAVNSTLPMQVFEAFRRAPSASNKQPWRLVLGADRKDSASTLHLYLKRTPGYGTGMLAKLANFPDIQMIDMGIALAHFELAAKELGIQQGFSSTDPTLTLPDAFTEYVATVSLGGKAQR